MNDLYMLTDGRIGAIVYRTESLVAHDPEAGATQLTLHPYFIAFERQQHSEGVYLAVDEFFPLTLSDGWATPPAATATTIPALPPPSADAPPITPAAAAKPSADDSFVIEPDTGTPEIDTNPWLQEVSADECTVEPRSRAEIARIRQEDDTWPEREYVLVGAADPDTARAVAGAARQIWACDPPGTSGDSDDPTIIHDPVTGVPYALESERLITEGLPQGVPGIDPWPPERVEIYRHVAKQLPMQEPLDYVIDGGALPREASSPDYMSEERRVVLPEDVVMRPDGRAAAPHRSIIRTNHPDGPAAYREPFPYHDLTVSIFVFEDGRWVLDEILPLCIGECGFWWDMLVSPDPSDVTHVPPADSTPNGDNQQATPDADTWVIPRADAATPSVDEASVVESNTGTPEVDTNPLPPVSAAECTIEPLTVDEVIARTEAPLLIEQPISPEPRAALNRSSELINEPPSQATLDEIAAVHRQWVACNLKNSYFQAWALIQHDALQRTILDRYPVFTTEEEIRADLEALWAGEEVDRYHPLNEFLNPMPLVDPDPAHSLEVYEDEVVNVAMILYSPDGVPVESYPASTPDDFQEGVGLFQPWVYTRDPETGQWLLSIRGGEG